MPIIKHVAVRKHPLKLLQYITRGDKTDEAKYVTGLNCTADVQSAYQELATTFECFSKERFYKKSLNEQNEENGEKVSKEKIRLHHYIQSFKPGEVTPEEAHEIGIEWAKRVFGNNHQVLVSTHIDKGHIHNHFAVSAYDLEGKHWIDNKTTLRHCWKISNEIALEHGLSAVENEKYKANHKYGEWLARQNGTSWKQKLCDDIDRLILQDDVRSIDDLVEQLRKLGYIVNHGKHISVKAVKNRKAVRTLRLGDGYGVEELQYRIEHKNQEMSLAAVAKYEGIQREYALCLRQLQIMVFRKTENPMKASFSDLRKNAELLCFLTERNIRSVTDFENLVNDTADKSDELYKKKKQLQSDIEKEEQILAVAEKYAEINSKENPTPAEIKELMEIKKKIPVGVSDFSKIEAHKEKLAELKSQLAVTEETFEAVNAEKKEYGGYYRNFLRQMQSDYDVLLEKARAEQQAIEEEKDKAEKAQQDMEEANRRNRER
ncbi:MAG: relaxase/mobilization nuclease domain-containing protein [Ruminococcus sp.]|nr:relaxase/mobilization nuclease domain-containing protein [Ruminococcus sp.]